MTRFCSHTTWTKEIFLSLPENGRDCLDFRLPSSLNFKVNEQYSGWVVGFFFLVFFMESTQNSCGLDFTTRHVALRSSKKRLSASWLWWALAFNKRDERLFLPQNIYSYSWMKTYIWMGKEVHSLSCKVYTHPKGPKIHFSSNFGLKWFGLC